MNDIFGISPVPTLLVSPSRRIEAVSVGLLNAWRRRRSDFVEKDLVAALYEGSPTERFDRISLLYAIKTAVAARTLRLCHSAFVEDNISWTARITPFHRGDELLCLTLVWEKDTFSTATEDEPSRVFPNEAFSYISQVSEEYAISLLDARGIYRKAFLTFVRRGKCTGQASGERPRDVLAQR
ncbi:hypothetical protein Purlil1_13630 [Purpureocillium lilacinum]|uniref:Uncharacterized protein n=1 Tax=Purpureocillium lilacinum TaxID=33203 RepID=A0ABR0BDI5_PURLI|nr:hypothetical protein Purlil1_13630 [Purpureocillium lilacinum]